MRSIRWKLILTSLLVVFLPVWFLSQYAINSFDQFAARAQENEMTADAFLLGELFKSLSQEGAPPDSAIHRAEFRAVFDSVAARTQARFQVVATNGIVLLDSTTNEPPEVGMDISSRKEMSKISNGKYGSSWNISDDRKLVFYHIAVPVERNGQRLIVVRVSRHTNPIVKVILKMVRDQRAAMWVAFLIAVVFSAILAHTMTRRLRLLTKAAADFANTGSPAAISVKGRDEIGELGRAFERMQTELQKRNRYNREFISGVMHELKMPLTAIKGAAELLEQGAAEKKDAREKFISNIRYEADRMTRLVSELNELTRLDAESFHSAKEEVNYPIFVREILARLEPGFDSTRAAISLKAPEKAMPVRLVPGRIEQVIGNLIENALRYTPPTGTVEITIEETADKAVLTTVRDTGGGIAAANLSRIFDRFFTTEPKDKPKDYGSGLGLAIAKTIVENHGGKIWAESAPGKGSAFFFTLPTAG